MSILVTGATGFIGSVLTSRLVDDGADVRILRRPTSALDLLGATADRVEHREGDVTDPSSVLEAMQGIDQVYHAAAYIGFGGARVRQRLRRVNEEGTAHVVNAALRANVKRLVYTSSMAAFGPSIRNDGYLDETATWQSSRSDSGYGWSKHAGELQIHRGIAEGLDAVIVNPSLVFGIGRAGENTRQIVDRVRRGAFPLVPTGGTNVVDVLDVTDGHIRAMAHGRTGARYFLGAENLTWRAILETLADAFAVPPPRRSLPPVLALTVGALGETAAFFTGGRAQVTRRLARQAARLKEYDNTRAVNNLACSFRPFADTARRIADALQ